MLYLMWLHQHTHRGPHKIFLQMGEEMEDLVKHFFAIYPGYLRSLPTGGTEVVPDRRITVQAKLCCFGWLFDLVKFMKGPFQICYLNL